MNLNFSKYIQGTIKSKYRLLLVVFCFLLAIVFIYPILKNVFYLLLNDYLSIIIPSALQVGKTIGLNLVFNDDIVFDYLKPLSDIIVEIVLAFSIIWIIKSRLKEKIFFTFLIILLLYILNIFQFIGYVLFLEPHYASFQSRLIINLFSIYCLIFIIWIYIYRNRENVYVYFRNNISFIQFKKVLRHVIFALTVSFFVYIIYLNFIPIHLYMNAIAFVADKLLSILGFNAILDGYCILGKYGNVCVLESCLGFKTMFVFALGIYFTGVKLYPKLLFISFGLIMFNFFNIIRILLVFIHLQIYKNYPLAEKAHDLLKYPLHLTVLIIWIVWLMKFSDIWYYTKKLETPPADSPTT
jgi:exosortase/archaeosortase family protein